MKKLLPLLIVFMMILTSVSCTVVQQPEPTTAPNPTATPDSSSTVSSGEYDVKAWGAKMKELYNGQKVNCLVASHASTEAYSALADGFTDLTGIDVEMKVMSSNDMKALQRTNSSTSGGAFDMYMVDCTMLAEFAQAGYLVNMDKYLSDAVMTPEWFDYEDILAAYRNLGIYEGSTYAIPIAGESFFVGYRKDLFEKHNKQIPASLEEMLELARYFKGSDDVDYGFVCRGLSGAHCGCVWNTLSFCFSDDPARNHVTGEYKFDDSMAECFEYYHELTKCGPADISTYTHEDTTALFSQGKSAMWLEATTLAATVENPSSSSVAGKVGYFPIPDGKAGCTGVVGGWTLGIPNDGKAKEPAWALIMYLTSKEMAGEYSDNGGAPNRASIFDDPEILAKYPFYADIKKAVENSARLEERGLNYMYNSPEFNNIRVIVGTELNRVIVNEIDAATALANCQKQLDELIQNK